MSKAITNPSTLFCSALPSMYQKFAFNHLKSANETNCHFSLP